MQAGFGDGWCFCQRLDAVGQQGLVVELHPVGGFVLDAIPESFEVGTVQHGLATFHLPAFVRVLDLQAAGELAQDLLYLGELGRERLRQNQCVVLERCT